MNKAFFLNDAVINKSNISRLIHLNLETPDEKVFDVSGDGLIISSPIGSTAYSMAAGGPILHPHLSSFVITPICPHSLNHRPIVISNTIPLTIQSKDKQESISLTIDGQEQYTVKPYQFIKISKNTNRYVKFIVNKNRSFFDTIRTKFTYGRV